MSKIESLFSFADSFAYDENDNSEKRFLKKLLLLMSLFCSISGALWSLIYNQIFGWGLTTALPLIFVVFVSIAIDITHYVQKTDILVNTLLFSISLVPAFIDFSLGGILNSGYVIFWCFLAPIGALIFLDKSASLVWFASFIIIVLISIIIQPQLTDDARFITNDNRIVFNFMNLIAPFSILFLAFYWYVKQVWYQRSLNKHHLKISYNRNREIYQSLTYAKRLQSSMLPSEEEIREILPDSFVYYQPKDLVAGDFYWVSKRGDKTFVAVCDCTGHGVPGAMLSVICNSALNRAVNEFDIQNSSGIFNKCTEIIKHTFQNSEIGVSDGMDAVLIGIEGNKLCFSGANNSLWLVKKDSYVVEQISGNRYGISAESPGEFDEIHMNLEKGDTIYLMTDGFADQFGGQKGKKYKTKRLKDLVFLIHQNPMESQKNILRRAFNDWKGDFEQVDDVCVMGIRV